MEEKKVKDIMIPIKEYATVHENDTLLDVIKVLDECNRKIPEGQYKLRSVLVVNRSGKIIGKIAHLGFLKALEPKYDHMPALDELSSSGLSSDYLQSIMRNMNLWDDAFCEYCDIAERAEIIQVHEVMDPINKNINADASIFDAIHKIIMWNMLSIPVTRNHEVVGIIRQADIYKEISEYIKNSCKQ
ncbi:MAG: CBS domain-containing protein [Fibrobacteria bacterium]|nr:CBS domain-containing protein [Fibrobacteria bacterium]